MVWAIANLTFLRDDNGNPVSWVGQFQDITARHGMETDSSLGPPMGAGTAPRTRKIG